MNITVYTTQTCPNCSVVKAILAQRHLQYTEIRLDNPVDREAFFVQHPSVRQMPQVFINDQRVGGVEGLRAALKVIDERGLL